MIYYESECVSCGFPCLFESCPYYKVMHSKCDKCGEEDVRLYDYDGTEMCKECLLKEFDVVEGTEVWEEW